MRRRKKTVEDVRVEKHIHEGRDAESVWVVAQGIVRGGFGKEKKRKREKNSAN